MISVKVRAKVVEDNSGVSTEIPILLTEQGELSSLTSYLLELHLNGASNSTLDKTIRSVSLFLEYMDANSDAFDEPESLYRSFVRRLYSGTAGEDGIDPSGLYWVPASITTIKGHINRLTNFTDWLSDLQVGISLNPLRKATPHEERLSYYAWWRRTQHDFLGHIKDKSISHTIKQVRSIKGRTPLAKTYDDAISFPTSQFETFFTQGLGGSKDPRVALRDKLIVLLMHGAGLRLSEAISLWVTDVFEDPSDPTKSLVRIYDERDGIAPNGWKSRKGDRTRKAYLKEMYGRIPRRDMTNTQHVGWKSTLVDHKDGYMAVQWFPTEFGKVFMALWRTYLRYRATSDSHHPYAFISFDTRALGNVYTINAFNKNYAAALYRIGLEPNKAHGLGPHGHRHNYGRRLSEVSIDPLIRKKCLHHKSLDSQVIYTLPGNRRVSEMLNAASEQLSTLAHNAKSIDWKTLVEHGFEGIDPQGHFTGKHPTLGKE